MLCPALQPEWNASLTWLMASIPFSEAAATQGHSVPEMANPTCPCWLQSLDTTPSKITRQVVSKILYFCGCLKFFIKKKKKSHPLWIAEKLSKLVKKAHPQKCYYKLLNL